MTTINLLTGITTPMWITIGAVGLLAVVSVLYGVFRNFARVAWTGWQILAVFALSLLLRYIPLPDGWEGFAVCAAYLFGTTVAVLLIGAAVRGYMLRKSTRSNLFFRFCNRFLGAFTSLLNLVLLLAVLGGFALGVLYYVSPFEELNAVYENAVWAEFGAKYIKDLTLAAACLYFVRGGYRIGVARSLQTVVTLGLTVAALLLAMYLTLTVSFLRGWVDSIANGIAGGGLNLVVAAMISYLIVTLICFIVFFAVVLVLGFLLNKLVRKYRSVRALRYIDGVILSVIFFAFFLAIVCGWNYLLYTFASGNFDFLPAEYAEAAAGQVSGYAIKLSAFYVSSPLSALFFFLNPFLLL